MRAERDRPGRIFPPLLTVTYAVLPADRADSAVTVRLGVQYSVDMANSREQIEVGAAAAARLLWP